MLYMLNFPMVGWLNGNRCVEMMKAPNGAFLLVEISKVGPVGPHIDENYSHLQKTDQIIVVGVVWYEFSSYSSRRGRYRSLNQYPCYASAKKKVIDKSKVGLPALNESINQKRKAPEGATLTIITHQLLD